MRALLAAAALLAAGALAGCLAPAAELEPQTLAPALEARVATLLGKALPCEAEVGEGTSANVAEVARNALDRSGEVSVGELWLQGDRGYVARYGTGGASIVDLRDPLAPVELAAWDPPEGGRALDVKTTTDGTALLVGHDGGIRILDVRDGANPVLEHEFPFERTQAHMLTVFAVDGQDYVAVAKGDGEDLPIYRIAGGPGAHTLEPVSAPRLTTAGVLPVVGSPHDLLRSHDAFFLDDPLLGAPTLWVANVWDGIAALDVSDPASPRVIARIPNTLVQYTHTVQTVVVGEGAEARRITVSVSEVGVNTMRTFDTTDLANPVLLSEWSVPVPTQPQHNLQVVPPYVFVAHYAEGVFVFELDALASGGDRAVFPVARLAAETSGRASPSLLGMALGTALNFDGTWDVVVQDGLFYVTDAGLRVAAFGCMQPGDRAMTSLG